MHHRHNLPQIQHQYPPPVVIQQQYPLPQNQHSSTIQQQYPAPFQNQYPSPVQQQSPLPVQQNSIPQLLHQEQQLKLDKQQKPQAYINNHPLSCGGDCCGGCTICTLT